MLCIKGFFLLFGGRNAKQCTKHLKGRQGQVLNKFVTRVVHSRARHRLETDGSITRDSSQSRFAGLWIDAVLQAVRFNGWRGNIETCASVSLSILSICSEFS